MPSPASPSSSIRSSPRWLRYLVVSGIVAILLSIPWATWLVVQNLKESEATLEALSEPDVVRRALERFDRSMAEASTSVLHHASTVDRSDRQAYKAEQLRSDSLFLELELSVQNEVLRPPPGLDTSRQGAWLRQLAELKQAKHALLEEWVRFARTREGVNTDDIDALLEEARSLTADSVLDADAKRIKKKEYDAFLAQEDSLRDVRLNKLTEIEGRLEGLPKAVLALTEARQRKAAQLARRNLELDRTLREILDQWFQYRSGLEPYLVQQRQDNLADWQRGLWIVAISASALLSALGLVLAVLFRRTDRVQAALARTLEQERALVAAREAFLANMSHEIRTPLHAIGGFAERLARSGQPEVREQGQLIQDAGTHLLDLVNHILDYARLRGQPGAVRQQAFSPKALLEGTAALLEPGARDKGLDVVLDISDAVPEALVGDRLRLRQLLLNLGTNAVKYTEKGHVRLHATGQLEGADGFRLVLEVEDTGPGISAAEQERIFEPFRQLQGEGQSDATQGLGLGLAIVAELAQQMGARVDLDSRPGRGSLFRVSLRFPVAPADALDGRSDALDRSDARGLLDVGGSADAGGTASTNVPLQILAADDEPFNRKLLEAQLQDHPLIREGRLILHAVDGGEAAWSWIETAGTPPDLLLLDWRMPDLDGVALLERIRRRHPDVPAIALTAQADADALEALQQAGFDAVLEKPFGQSALFGHLDQLLGIAGVPSDEAALAELVDTPGGLDLTDLEALAGGDGTFVTDMLEIFLERLEATREHWEAAIENKDRKAIAEAAHKLAAPARQLGFTELAAALRALEEDADGDASIAALANRCRRLQPMLQTAQLQVAAKLEEGSQAP